MKVSIITVVYNREKTIARAVRSAQSQTYDEIEHLIIDGGSSDGTLAKIRGCRKLKETIVVSEPDHGLYDAINKGIARASGDVVGLLHSDDFFADDHVISNVMSEFKQRDIDAVLGDVEFFSRGKPDVVVRRVSSSKFTVRDLSCGIIPAHTAFFMRRHKFAEFGNYNITFEIAGDFEFFCRVFSSESFKYTYLPTTIVKMQIGGVSTTGIRSAIKINEEIMRACQLNGIQTSWWKILSRYPSKVLEFF